MIEEKQDANGSVKHIEEELKPADAKPAGAPFGFQIGGQNTDLVLIGRSHNAAEHLLHEK